MPSFIIQISYFDLVIPLRCAYNIFYKGNIIILYFGINTARS